MDGKRRKRRVRRRVSEAVYEVRRGANERRALVLSRVKRAAAWGGLALGGGVLLYLLFRLHE